MKRIIFFAFIVLAGLPASVFLSPVFCAEKTEKIEKSYVASTTGRPKYYHRPNCKLVGSIKPANMVIFGNKKNANTHGYIPCNICKP